MRSRLGSWARSQEHRPDLQPLTALSTTVVIPCYNHGAYLTWAVRSLVDQTLPQFATVFVDDASPDDTAERLPLLVEALSAKGPVEVVTHARNRGQAASLNDAIGHHVTTPLVTVLNDDDYLSPQALERAVETFRDLEGISLVGMASRWFTGHGPPPTTSLGSTAPPRRIGPAEVRRARRPNDLNMTHSGMTVRRDAWQSVGGYRSDPRTRLVPYSDRDLQLRVGALYPVAIIDEPLVWWRSDSSVDAGRNS